METHSDRLRAYENWGDAGSVYYDAGDGKLNKIGTGKQKFQVGDIVKVKVLNKKGFSDHSWTDAYQLMAARRDQVGEIIAVHDLSSREYFKRTGGNPYEYAVRFRSPIGGRIRELLNSDGDPYVQHFFGLHLELLSRGKRRPDEATGSIIRYGENVKRVETDDMSDLIVDLYERLSKAKAMGKKVANAELYFKQYKEEYDIMKLKNKPGIKKYLSRMKPVLTVYAVNGEDSTFKYSTYRGHALGNDLLIVHQYTYGHTNKDSKVRLKIMEL